MKETIMLAYPDDAVSFLVGHPVSICRRHNWLVRLLLRVPAVRWFGAHRQRFVVESADPVTGTISGERERWSWWRRRWERS